MSSRFRIGVGVFLFDTVCGDFIIGKRKGSWEAGTWALPGGHLEHGESFEDCAAREVLEETGIIVDPEMLRVLAVVNDLVDENGWHYVTVLVGCTVDANVGIQNMEPEKCEGWEWWSWAKLRDRASANIPEGREDLTTARLFPSLLSLFEQYPKFELRHYYGIHE